MSEDYLTEKKLENILKTVYPGLILNKQVGVIGRKVDYCLTFPKNLKTIDQAESIHIPEIVKEALERFDQECAFEGMTKRTYNEYVRGYIEDIRIVVEYDGFYHYTSNAQATKTEYGCKWSEIDTAVFELRIPYWLQIDPQISKQFFGTDKDFSNNFPHGFISKHCILPDRFCYEGENRFIEELRRLPKNISVEVLDSLLRKMHRAKGITSLSVASMGSMRLWRQLLVFYPAAKDFLDKIELIESDKFYKYITAQDYILILGSPFLGSLLANSYRGAIKTNELFLEHISRGFPDSNLIDAFDEAERQVEIIGRLFFCFV